MQAIRIEGLHLLEFGVAEFRVFGEIQSPLFVEVIGTNPDRASDQQIAQ
jgi:hypothetical protein